MLNLSSALFHIPDLVFIVLEISNERLHARTWLSITNNKELLQGITIIL